MNQKAKQMKFKNCFKLCAMNKLLKDWWMLGFSKARPFYKNIPHTNNKRRFSRGFSRIMFKIIIVEMAILRNSSSALPPLYIEALTLTAEEKEMTAFCTCIIISLKRELSLLFFSCFILPKRFLNFWTYEWSWTLYFRTVRIQPANLLFIFNPNPWQV